MKKVLSLVVAVLALGLASCAATGDKTTAGATEASMMTCATCPTKMTTAKTTKIWNGKTYGFCCSNCEASFTKNPEKYAK